MTGFTIVITLADDAQAIRHPLRKRITSLGSSVDADVVVPGVPSNWAAIYLDDHGGYSVRELGSTAQPLPVGVAVRCGTAKLQIVAAEADFPLEKLAERLASVESAEQALSDLVDAVVTGSNADIGAVILADRGGFTVTVARDAAGNTLADADSLLSDTVVREVLASGEEVVLDQVGGSAYAQVHSVVALKLSGMMCFPLRLGGKTLGALFIGSRQRSLQISDQRRSDIKLIAALAMPFLAQVRRRSQATPSSEFLIGDSAAMIQLRAMVKRISPTDLSVLVQGPSGSGKEVVARALHGASQRATKPLIAINCAAIAASLLDAELFGYRKGAFTGALTDRAGLIEAAAGGVLFLDEIGDMPLPMQASLLRVLEQREVRRLGELEARPVDFRLVAATHRDLHQEVRDGRFREDLLFRIAEVRIEVPPLAQRGDDILLLAMMFLRQVEAQLGLPSHELGDRARQALAGHAWPGNVRELRSCMRRAAILADHSVVGVRDLQLLGTTELPASDHDGSPPSTFLGDVSRPLEQARDEFIRDYVRAAVQRNNGNREDAAKELGIGVRTLYRYLA
jgi:DNA-binding NtrC family response regulator